jgi:Tfp pilus assembly protein PilF
MTRATPGNENPDSDRRRCREDRATRPDRELNKGACQPGQPEISRNQDEGGGLCDWAARIAPLLLVAALAVRPLGDVDFWWQNATGRWILQHGISPIEVFTTSRGGTPRIESSWLYCVVLYLLNGFVGATGLVLLKTTALIGIFGAIGPLWTRGRIGLIGPLALSLAIYSSHMRFVVRPELVTMGAFVVFLLLLDNQRLALWRRAVVLVVVQLVWVNTHSLFLLGPGMVACWAFEPFVALAAPFEAGRHRLRRAGQRMAVLLIVVVASLVNPYGWTAFSVPMHQLATLVQSNLTGVAIASGVMGLVFWTLGIASGRLARAGRPSRHLLIGAGLLVGLAAVVAFWFVSAQAGAIVREVTERISTPDGKYILELRSPLDPLVRGSHTLAGAVLALIAVLCVAFAPNRPRPHQVVLLAATIALTLLAVRNIALLSVCAGFIVWRGVRPTAPSPAPTLRTLRVLIGPLQLVLAATCLLLAWGAQTNRLYSAERWTLESGLGVSPDEDYSGAADFLESVGVRSDIFNTHGVGSFLLDRGLMVFVDSRAAAGVLDDVARVVGSDQLAAIDWVSEQYPIRAFVVEPRFLGLIGRLAAHPKWRLCYADPNTMVFLADDEAPLIDRLHMDDAWMRSMQTMLPDPQSPVETGVFGRLSSPHRFSRLAWVCMMAGAYGHARDLLEDAHRVDPSGFEHYDALAYANAASARLERAAELYEIAIRREPTRARLRMDAARAYLGLGELEQAEHHARAALAGIGAGPEGRFVLGTILLRQRRDSEAVAMLERAVRDAPNAPLYHSNLATAYIATDRVEEAAEQLLRAAALAPADAVFRRDACRVLASLKRYDEAERCLVEAERLDPGHPDLDELYALVMFRR